MGEQQEQQQRDRDVAAAERRLAGHEARVARQEEIIMEMERDNHPEAAAVGRTVLATLRTSLALCRDQLATLRSRQRP